MYEALTNEKVPPKIESLRVGLLDHDPELGISVNPACAAGVHAVGALLERLGHNVEIAWPDALDHLWSQWSTPFAVVSEAVRPPVIRWVSERLGRPVQRGELDDGVFEAAERSAARSEHDVRAAQEAIDATVPPIADWWSSYDLLVTPSTFQPA